MRVFLKNLRRQWKRLWCMHPCSFVLFDGDITTPLGSCWRELLVCLDCGEVHWDWPEVDLKEANENGHDANYVVEVAGN